MKSNDQQQTGQQPAREPMTAARLADIQRVYERRQATTDDYRRTWDTDFLMQSVPDLLAFAEAALPILRAVASCEAVRSPTFGLGGIEGIVLHHDSLNVLWMREQARALLAGQTTGAAEGAEGAEGAAERSES